MVSPFSATENEARTSARAKGARVSPQLRGMAEAAGEIAPGELRARLSEPGGKGPGLA